MTSPATAPLPECREDLFFPPNTWQGNRALQSPFIAIYLFAKLCRKHIVSQDECESGKKKDPTARFLQSLGLRSGYSATYYLCASGRAESKSLNVDSSHLLKVPVAMCARILVLSHHWASREVQQQHHNRHCGSGSLTHSRAALSHPTLFFPKYVHKCTGEHRWAQRRLCWRSLQRPRIINPPSDRQAEPERLGTVGQVIYGSKQPLQFKNNKSNSCLGWNTSALHWYCKTTFIHSTGKRELEKSDKLCDRDGYIVYF